MILFNFILLYIYVNFSLAEEIETRKKCNVFQRNLFLFSLMNSVILVSPKYPRRHVTHTNSRLYVHVFLEVEKCAENQTQL